MEPWDADEVARLPPEVQAVMGDRSGRIWLPAAGNKPVGMSREAAAIDPSRWSRD